MASIALKWGMARVAALSLAAWGLATPGLLSASMAHAQAAAQRTATAADNPRAAQDFIKTMSDRAFAVLRDKTLTKAQREARFRQLLGEGFALDYIALFTLGPARRSATEQQVRDYQAAFPDYVIRIYANRLTDYSDTSLRMTGVQPVGTRGDVMVRSTVAGGNVAQPVLADWRVRRMPDGGLRIIDLSIAGVSMASTQREEFQAVIQARGMDGLIRQLRTSAGPSAPAGAGR
jgi:phospholipid transport system substrate-binding protein